MKRKLYPILGILLVLFLFFSACAPAAPPAETGDATLSVRFLDVGQGDSIFLSCKGETMLIDAGEPDQGDAVVSALRALRVERLNYLVGTHPHADHIGGLERVLSEFPVEKILMPRAETDTRTFESLLDAVAEKGLKVTAPEPGTEFDLGEARVEVLGPREIYEDLNDCSLVLRVTLGRTSFLFTGDMEAGAEEDLLESGANLTARVLKVGHHGSETSSSEPFLDAVAPQYAVISVGEGNSYGHPAPQTLEALSRRGAEVFRTDLDGTILAESDGRDIEIAPEETGDTLLYIGNRNSKKFHLPDCASLPAEENRVSFGDRAAAVAAGYTPCGGCKP